MNTGKYEGLSRDDWSLTLPLYVPLRLSVAPGPA